MEAANSKPCEIKVCVCGMQQQHNLHMGTTMMHASAHVQVARCCCIPLQLTPMDAGAHPPNLQQFALVVFFLVSLVHIATCTVWW